MRLEELQALGAFVSQQPEKVEIRFKLDGDTEHTATIHIKRISIGDQERLALGDPDQSRSARFISQVVTLGDGSERISYEEAYRLHPRLAIAMVKAIVKVNGAPSKN